MNRQIIKISIGILCSGLFLTSSNINAQKKDKKDSKKLTEMKSALKKWQEDTNAKRPVTNAELDPAKRYQWGKHPDRK